MAENLAEVSDVEQAWRPLTKKDQRDRAAYLVGLASRKVRREYRDVDDRIASAQLAVQDVKDVIVGLVLQALPLSPHPGARTWQVSSGAESRSITLGEASSDPNAMRFTDWMLDILDASPSSGGPLPAFSAPPAEAWPDPYQHRGGHVHAGWLPR